MFDKPNQREITIISNVLHKIYDYLKNNKYNDIFMYNNK